MAAPLTETDRLNIVNLYRSGATAKEIVEKVGCSNTTVFRVLRSNGIKARGKRIPMPDGVLESFNNGESVYSIANRLNVSRPTVIRWLSEAGITTRSQSEAGIVRAAAMTAEERAAQAAAAHEAVRGRIVPESEKIQRSKSVEQRAANGAFTLSDGESAMLNWLTNRGFNCTLQKSEWIYNLDIAISDNFAIEIFGGNWHAIKQRRIHEVARLEYLLGRGWNIVYIWNTPVIPMHEICADKVVEFFNFTSDNPSSRGKYWVIRGDGQISTAASSDVDESSFVLPSHSCK